MKCLKIYNEKINSEKIDFSIIKPLSTQISREELEIYITPNQKIKANKRDLYCQSPNPIIPENKIDFYNKNYLKKNRKDVFSPLMSPISPISPKIQTLNNF